MYKKETESMHYVEIPAEQPNKDNLFEFKTLNDPPSSESQTETSHSCSNKQFVVKPSEMQSPKLKGMFKATELEEPMTDTPSIHSTISYQQMRDIPEELEELTRREKKDINQWKIHVISMLIVSVS